jgi:hypothetical protein
VALRPAILDAGQQALGQARPGARFRYVFHRSSGSSESAVREAVSYGVVKLNVDTDDQYAFTRAVADHVLVDYAGVLKLDGGVGNNAAYDSRAWGRKAEAAMAAQLAAACELVGSAGRSLLSYPDTAREADAIGARWPQGDAGGNERFALEEVSDGNGGTDRTMERTAPREGDSRLAGVRGGGRLDESAHGEADQGRER